MRGAKTAAWSLLAGTIALLLFGWPQVAGAVSLAPHFKIQRDVTYGTVDGVPLKMDVYYPRVTQAPAPAIVYIHGGGWYTGDKTGGAGFSTIPELAAHGYLVASIDYRLAPRYAFPAQIEDVKGAIRHLRASAGSYNIDPERIGVLGDSAGGHLAALAGVTDDGSGFDVRGANLEQSSRVQAVVDMFGPADLALFYRENYSLHIQHVFGTDDPLSPVIKKASPVSYVSADDPPFFILHGDSDAVVPLDQSLILYRYLKAAGVPADLTIIDHCGHDFKAENGALNPDREEITRLITGFFNKFLKSPSLHNSN